MQQPCLGLKQIWNGFWGWNNKHQETEVLFSRNQLLYAILRGGNGQGFLASKYPFVPFFTTPHQDSRGYSRSKPWNTLKHFAVGQHQFEDLAKKHHLITNNWIRLNYFQNVNSFCIMVPDPCIHSNLLQFESWLRWTRAVSASLIRNLRHWLVPNGLWKNESVGDRQLRQGSILYIHTHIYIYIYIFVCLYKIKSYIYYMCIDRYI